ncbi:MBL fold metallo-hydrolase [Paenibacillus antibioticophila]|uniref:MBL fold metallo-hydrolase n=1 Tax=Paenibacillus antibioticophila TaxID=1274374 RepID=UPI0005C9CA83|nr:MBL fold metallo-hydrolase [Paenibacillus antibioticophila]
MKIHFLGTAAAEGYPNAFCRCGHCQKARELGGKNIRTRSSAIIDDIIKFDYSPDSYMQALRDQVDMGAIQHLLVTHTHTDHYNPYDLDSRTPGIAHGIDHLLNICGNDAAMHKSRIAIGRFIGQRFALHLMRPFRTIILGDTTITPLPADHDPLETCLLYCVERNQKKLLYGHDTGWLPEDTWSWLQGRQLDFAILDCTSAYTGSTRDRNHMGVETILETQKRFRAENILRAEGRMAVTHFSHNSGLTHGELEDIFRPVGIEPAYDGWVTYI